MVKYDTADYAVFQKFLWKVSFGILFCISLIILSGQSLVMPCQAPSITIGPDQQEDGFLVKASNEYLGGVSPAPGLQPSTLESALPSFLPSIHPFFSPSLHPIVWGLSPFQMLQLHQTKKNPRSEVLVPFTDHGVFSALLALYFWVLLLSQNSVSPDSNFSSSKKGLLVEKMWSAVACCSQLLALLEFIPVLLIRGDLLYSRFPLPFLI